MFKLETLEKHVFSSHIKSLAVEVLNCFIYKLMNLWETLHVIRATLERQTSHTCMGIGTWGISGGWISKFDRRALEPKFWMTCSIFGKLYDTVGPVMAPAIDRGASSNWWKYYVICKCEKKCLHCSFSNMPFSNGQKHYLSKKKKKSLALFAIHSFLFLSLSFYEAYPQFQFAQFQD